jgi:hypothetical protein
MPQFSLRRLLFSVGLIGIGLCVQFTFAAKMPLLESPLALALHILSAAIIGAGALHPFKKAWLGALTGALIWLAFLIIVASTVDI